MGEKASNEKAPKKDFVKGLKAEFNKIVWPGKQNRKLPGSPANLLGPEQRALIRRRLQRARATLPQKAARPLQPMLQENTSTGYSCHFKSKLFNTLHQVTESGRREWTAFL